MSLNSLIQKMIGVFGNAGADEDDVKHAFLPNKQAHFNVTAGTDESNLVFVAQAPITLLAAYLVPDVATAANGTNYATIQLGKGDLAAGAITAFDSFDTSSTGLAARTKRSFSIDPSTDVLAKGDGLYLIQDQTSGGSGAAVKGKVVVEYELTG